MNRQPDRQPPTREIVNQLAREVDDFTVQDVTLRTGTSRQAVHRQLAQLVRAGVLVSEGKGRATRYRPTTRARKPAMADTTLFERRYPREGLAEDHVWAEVAGALPSLAAATAKNARAAMGYALTEMVNNAIDHSNARTVLVRAGGDDQSVWFAVEDDGIGAF
ncbi:MAG TPA: MarR family transcriptional regulator, partial [Polyangia bacterium]